MSRVLAPIRARDNQQASWRQDSFDLAHHRLVLIVMLEGLEADHDVDALTRERDGGAASRNEPQVRPSIPPAGVLEDFRDDVDADDMGGDTRHQIRPVPLAAGDVENTSPVDEFTREQIPVDVLEPYVARHFGHIALASPFESAAPVV